MQKVALIHTGFALVDVLIELFKEILPDVELIHILDDSLLREVLKDGEVRNPVRRRMLAYFIAAEAYKVDCILNVCSSVGEVANMAREIINTPIVKIDEKMVEEAIRRTVNIGVAATLKTTLDPTCRLLEKKASAVGKEIFIQRTLCPGAFEELMGGNSKKHDVIVLKGIEEISKKVDVVVLAQGSMARLSDSLPKRLSNKVLSSPRSGVQEVKKVLLSKEHRI